MRLRPQPGPQEAFLGSLADIVIFGGAAGGGKSYALLLEPLRYATRNPGFSATIFRRSTVQVRNPGGLWDESAKLYAGIPGAKPLQQPLEWTFRGGGKVKFSHLEHESTVFDWQGSQLPLLCFDELCHFSETQFFYMLSRNRSMCGVRPYVRATCNPDADSWVATFVSWWIDQETGLAIPERSGVLRWFVRVGNTLVWADSPAELAHYTMPNEDGAAEVPIPPKSVAFIPARLDDNKALTTADPQYRANLLALTYVERERLLNGNWKVRPAAGLYYQRTWSETVEAAPSGLQLVRGWDLAATPETGTNDPDWTVGVLMGRTPGAPADRRFVVLDVRWLRGSPGEVQKFILNTAAEDGRGTMVALPQDPAQAGKSQAQDYARRLAGYVVRTSVEARTPPGTAPTPSRQSAKITRFSPFSAQAEAGNVTVLRGAWNKRWIEELEAFPEAKHEDSADATARAFNELTLAHAPAKVTSLRM